MKSIFIIFLLMVCPLAWGELHTLTSPVGISIRAELLSLNKDTVKIKKEDGAVFSLQLDKLDEESQQLVREYFLRDENSLNKDMLTVSFKQNKHDKKNKETDSRNDDIRKVNTVIKLKYKGAAPLRDIVICYKAYYTEERLKSERKNFRQEKFVAGKIKIPTLPVNRLMSFETKKISLHETSFKEGYYNDDIDETKAEDKQGGIWIRIYKDENMFYEVSNPPSIARKYEWKTGREK